MLDDGPALRVLFCSRNRAYVAECWEIRVNRRRMQVVYSGSVQGVGFRFTVKWLARGFEVTGTVRNLADGRVEMVAEGTRDELEAFRQGIRDTGMEHFIRDEAVSWSESRNEFRGFEIVG